MTQFVRPYKIHPERTRAWTMEETRIPHRPNSASRPSRRGFQRAVVVNPAFQEQFNEPMQSVHEEDMEPTLMEAPQVQGPRRVTKRENINVTRECEWDVKDIQDNSRGRRTQLNKPLVAVLGVVCLTSFISLLLTLLILSGLVGAINCSCGDINGVGSTGAMKADDDRIEKFSENITMMEKRMEEHIQEVEKSCNEQNEELLRNEIEKLRTLLENQTAKLVEHTTTQEKMVTNLTNRLASTLLELKAGKAQTDGQIAGLWIATNFTTSQLSKLKNVWKAVNATVEETANLTNKVDNEFKNVWRGVNDSTERLLSEMTSYIQVVQLKVTNEMETVWLHLNESRECCNNLTTSLQSFRANVTYRSQRLENRIDIEEQKSNNLSQSLENVLNVTRKDIKEVSQEHFKTLWLAGNFTNAELHRIWTTVNSTQINLLWQLKKVKENLTEQLNLTTVHLQTSDASLFTSLMDVNASITEKVNDVSKMAGPIGPPGHNGSQGPAGPVGSTGPTGPKGAGDFSSCQYRVVEDDAAGGTTNAAVGQTEPDGKVILGATCSTNFAAEYNLLTQLQATGKWRYVCSCRGPSALFMTRGAKNCYLHYWECPLTT